MKLSSPANATFSTNGGYSWRGALSPREPADALYASRSVEVLEECLGEQKRKTRGDVTGLGRCFQKKLARVNAAPWMLATGEDYRYLGIEGGMPDRKTRLMHRYMDRVMQLSTRDADVRLALLEAFNLIKAPTALFSPRIIARILRQAITHRRGTAAPETTKSKLPEAA